MRFYICNEFLFFEGFPNHITSTDFILLFYLNKSEHILIILPITSSPHTKKEILSEAAQIASEKATNLATANCTS